MKDEYMHLKTSNRKNNRHGEIWDALLRVKNGKPNNEALKALAQKNKLVISVSNVAIEARCSRTVIGHKDCRYPDIFQEIQNSRMPQDCHTETLQNLTDDLRLLIRKLAGRKQANSELNERMQQYENVISVRDRGSVRAQIASPNHLYEETNFLVPTKRLRVLRILKREFAAAIAEFDALNAHMLLTMRSYDKGRTLDNRPVKPSTYAERRKAFTLIGKGQSETNRNDTE